MTDNKANFKAMGLDSLLNKRAICLLIVSLPFVVPAIYDGVGWFWYGFMDFAWPPPRALMILIGIPMILFIIVFSSGRQNDAKGLRVISALSLKLTNKIPRTITITLLIVLSLWTLLFRGCVESNFLLAKESRLPKWVKLPSGYTRADVDASLFLYIGSKARFIVRGPDPERKTLIDVLVKADWHDTTIQERKRRGTYEFSPHYYSASYKGIDDLIKFRCKGPIFWMADNIDNNIRDTEPECPEMDSTIIGNPW